MAQSMTARDVLQRLRENGYRLELVGGHLHWFVSPGDMPDDHADLVRLFDRYRPQLKAMVEAGQ